MVEDRVRHERRRASPARRQQAERTERTERAERRIIDAAADLVHDNARWPRRGRWAAMNLSDVLLR